MTPASPSTPTATLGDTPTREQVVLLTGRFDAFETESFRVHVEQLIDAGVTAITVDLQDVVFIDSSALAELVRAMKRCRTAGGELRLRAPSDPVQVILELTRLDAAFEIVPAPS